VTSDDSIYNGKPYIPRNVKAVRFRNSKDYDLVSVEFLKRS